MQLLHQTGEIIAQRYRILDTLGQGGVGTTYEAIDLQSGERVALKALSLRRMTDWKKIELFEREARILSQLNHPAIPRYKDYFQVDTPEDRSFYIAQQLAQGKSLAALVESGWHPDEALVRHLATQILEILVYLHQLTPPVIHRDIKPQNIIRQDNGQVFLVDFGAVQDTYHHTVTGGSTVVGTYGYMAPEQFRGQAVPSTDLYGLGTTLLFLLTQKSPSDLPQRQLKIDFRSQVCVSKDFADWLERMLEPVIEDRLACAKEALAVLEGEQALSSSLAPRRSKPKYSPITLTKTNERLFIEIPPVWFRTKQSRFFGFLTLTWNGIFWLPLLFLSTLLSLPHQIVVFGFFISPPDWLPIFLRLIESITHFTVGFFLGIYVGLGLFMLLDFILRGTSRIRLEFNKENFWLQQTQERTEDINQVKLSCVGMPLDKKLFTACEIRCRLRKYRFGLFLTQQEKEWLVGEITAFLDKLR